MAGVVFRYHTNRHYYLFALADGNKARLAVSEPLEPRFASPLARAGLGARSATTTRATTR